MSWAGAALGLGIALAVIGAGMALWVIWERQERQAVEHDAGIIGVGAALLVAGATLMGSVLFP